MTNERRQFRPVNGEARTVRELLGGRKYSIDYYQREYKWKSKQVTELIDDLAGKFLDSYEDGDERNAVADYGHGSMNKPGQLLKSPTNLEGVVQIIDKDQDLNYVALAFLAFRYLTGEKVKMFDFAAVHTWCSSHEPKCK